MKLNKFYTKVSIVILSIISMLLCGCASTVKVPMQVPPKNTAGMKLKRVAVLPFAGNFGDEVVPYLQNALAQVEVDGKPYFTIVERVNLKKVFEEQGFQMNGPVDRDTIIKFGKMIGAEGIYIGEADVRIIETTHGGTIYCPVPGDEGSCIVYKDNAMECLKTVFTLELIPKLIDVATGKIVYSDYINKPVIHVSCKDRLIRTAPNRRTILNEAIAAAMKTFQNNMITHRELVDVTFMDTTKGITDSKGKTLLEKALALTEQNRFNDACEIFKSGTDKYPKSIAYKYNAGICYEAEGDYQKALDFYIKVDSILDKPLEYISASIVRTRKRITDVAKYKKVVEQQTAANTEKGEGDYDGRTKYQLRAATEPPDIKQQRKQYFRQRVIDGIKQGSRIDLKSADWELYVDNGFKW